MYQDKNLPDQALIAACLAGEAKAYSQLVIRHQQKVYGLLFRFLGGRDDAEDICQETFVTAYQKLRLFDGRSSFSTWVCKIALNKARDFIRAGKTEAESLADGVELESVADEPDATPAHALETRQVGEQVQRLLRKLPATYREVLILKHIEGYSHEEIAEMIDATVENVKVRTFRARQLFKQLFDKEQG